MSSEKVATERFDWNRVIGPCAIGSLVVAAIPTAFMVWDRTRPQGQSVTAQEATLNASRWLFPVVMAAMLLGIGLNLVASVISRRKHSVSSPGQAKAEHEECNKAINRWRDSSITESAGRKAVENENALLTAKLKESESTIKHWREEVKREQLLRTEQVEIRDRQIGEQGGRIANLEQQLQVSQNTVDGLREQLSVPNGGFKLKKVRYVATEGRDGKLPEKDLTEFFEDRFLENGRLVIPPGLYRKLFGRPNDPFEGVPKLLEIEFIHAGHKMSVLLPENISVTMPFPYAVTKENMS